MKTRVDRSHSGQALVEFALVILVLMFIIFVLIEATRLFQANLTVQNAARAAGRYAITGQFETDCLLETPPCGDPRVESVRRVAEQALAGLPVNPEADARLREPNAYLIEVLTPAIDGSGWIEGVGDPGAPVLVRVLYETNMVTPLVRPIATVVRVTGQVVMNNEQVTQVSGTSGEPLAPNLPPPPPPPTPPPPPDVGLVKSGPPRALTGSQFNYSLIVTNHSAERDATGVQLVDRLPNGVSLVSADGCEPAGDDVNCHIGLLRPLAERRFTIRVEAGPDPGPVVNEAEVTLLEADPDLDNNLRSFRTILEEDPQKTDVVMYKTGPALVQAGEQFAYSLLVANESLIRASDVTVIDTLPSGVTNVQVPGFCGHVGGTVTCQIGDLEPLSDMEIVFYVTAPETPGTIRNEARAFADSPEDEDDTNNEDFSETQVVVYPDLRVTMIDVPDPVSVGADLTYQITVDNYGLGTATNVILDDFLPIAAEFRSVTPSASCQRGGNTVTCSLGTLVPGASTGVTIVVRPVEPGTIVNTATVRSAEPDRTPADNTASVSTAVQAETDLAITKTGPTVIEQGTPFDYHLTVTNNGPSAATGVTVRDTLPSGVSVLSATPSQGYCDTATHPLICSLGRLSSGAVATIVIRVVPIAETSLLNRAVVTGGENDPLPGNNATSWSTNVVAGDHFMVASPLCGEVGTRITLQGYNWKRNQAVTLSWNGTAFATLPMRDGDSWSTVYTVPDPSPDAVYTIRAADVQGRVATVQFTIPCPAPNLIISQPVRVGSGVIVAGDPVTFRATIRNIGNLDAVSQFFVGLYVNPNPEPVPATTHLPAAQRNAIVAVSGLEVGAEKTVTFTLADGLEAGTNRIFGVVDSDPGPVGVILERRETDNVSTALELEVESSGGGSATPTPTATPANPGNIAGRVRNEAGNPQANVGIWLYNASSAEVGTAYSGFDGSYYFASVSAGTYSMIACIRIEDSANPGIYRDYSATVPGVTVQSGFTTTQNLFLQLAPEGCPRP